MTDQMNVHMSSGQPKGKVYVANIGPKEFFLSRTYGPFHILPCPKAQSFQLTIIEDAEDRLDMGDQRYHWIPLGARAIAEDLVKSDMLDVHGVFVCAGTRPTLQEMEEARLKMQAYYKAMVQKGDEAWARYHRHEFIDDNSRAACLAMGVDREWAYQAVQKVVCPGCGESVRDGIARHSCGWILDIDKAVGGGLIDELEAKRLKALRARHLKAEKTAKPAAGTFAAGAEEEEREEDPVEAARAAVANK